MLFKVTRHLTFYNVIKEADNILKDGVERTGGLYCGTLVWAGWENPSNTVDWPEVQTQPGFIPVLQNLCVIC